MIQARKIGIAGSAILFAIFMHVTTPLSAIAQSVNLAERDGGQGSQNGLAAANAEADVLDVEIEINVPVGETTDNDLDDYISVTNAPGLPKTRCRAKLKKASPMNQNMIVVISNKTGAVAADGVVRFPDEANEETAPLTLLADGTTWAEFWISGKKVSSAKDDVVLEARKDTSSGSLVGKKKLTVLRVDLDVDSNNDYNPTLGVDGSIDANDDNEDKFEAAVPGAIVCLDGKGMDVPPASGECYIPLKLKLEPSLTTGTLTLQAFGGGADPAPVQVFTTSGGAGPIDLTTSGNINLSSLPSTLWVDGIALGAGELRLTYKDEAGNVVHDDSVGVKVVDTISYAPRNKYATLWMPYNWTTNDGAGGLKVDWTPVLDILSSHGYDITSSYADNRLDDNPEQCTHAKFRALAGRGVVIFSTHGAGGPTWSNVGSISAAMFTTRAAAQAWIDSVPGGPSYNKTGMSVKRWGASYYYVAVSYVWFQNNMKVANDDSRSIVEIATCHGADGGNNVMDNCGGRAVFAYEGSVTGIGGMVADFTKLLNHMSNLDTSRGRTAGRAFNGGAGYKPMLRKAGKDWTTLGPAVQYAAKSFYDNKGAAVIVFDTYMDYSVSADVAVVCGSGSARRWFAPIEGTIMNPRFYGISCDLTAASVTLTAKGDKCMSLPSTGNLGFGLTGAMGAYKADYSW